MRRWTLREIEPAVRSAWGIDTCDPHDLADWHPGNPARGQCGATALVVNDLLGGDLVVGEETVTGGRVVERPPGPVRRCREQYETLLERVLASLG